MSTGLMDMIAAGNGPFLVPLTVDQYHEMARAGIIPEASPIELMDGLLVWKDRSRTGGDPMSHDPRHILLITRLVRLLEAWVAPLGYSIRAQSPISLTNRCEPEPDVAVVRGSFEDYAQRHPDAADVAVAIEVADSSLRYDQTTKQTMYATAGIPRYWIVNLREQTVEVYDRPNPATELYESQSVHRPGDTLRLCLDGNELSVDLAQLLA
ncbi:MAG: Uma2 family endonuclease [Planctomycetales bacterium]